MIKKTITYTDFDDSERTEDYWFHLGKADLIDIELSTGNLGLEGWIKNALKKQDGQAVLNMYKKFIGLAVGQRTADGRFIKSKEYSEAFLSSEAYGELLTEMFQKPESGTEFLRSLLSKDVRATLDEVQEKQEKLQRELESEKIQGATPHFGVIDEVKSTNEVVDLASEMDLLDLYERQGNKPKQKRLEEMTRYEQLALTAEEFYELAGGTNPKRWPKTVLRIALMRRNAGLQ